MPTNRYVFSENETCDLVEAYGSLAAALDAAIDLARERARLYILPCRWSSRLTPGLEIVVTRKHSSSKGKNS